MESGGDLPDDVDDGQIVRDEVILGLLRGGDLSGVQTAQVLGCECQLQSEQHGQPGDVNPDHGHWDQRHDAVDRAVQLQFGDAETEDVPGRDPDQSGYGGAPDGGSGFDFRIRQNVIQQEQSDESNSVG